MDENDKQLLLNLRDRSEENNMMLRKIIKYHKIGVWTKIIYYTILVLLALGAFTLLKPYWSTIEKSFYNLTNLNKNIEKVNTQLR